MKNHEASKSVIENEDSKKVPNNENMDQDGKQRKVSKKTSIIISQHRNSKTPPSEVQYNPSLREEKDEEIKGEENIKEVDIEEENIEEDSEEELQNNQ